MLQKSKEVRQTEDGESISLDIPSMKLGVEEWAVDLEKDLGLSLKRDFGVMGWTPRGIFIGIETSMEQVRNIRRVVEAKHGWKVRAYGSNGYAV